MTFEKFAELDWWMKVYAAVAPATLTARIEVWSEHTAAAEIADRAVKELRLRIPENRKWQSDVLWAPPPTEDQENRCPAHPTHPAHHISNRCEMALGHEGAHRSAGLTWY